MYKLVFTKQAQKDAKKLSASNLKKKAKEILGILQSEPFCDYPPYEKLIGDLTGSFSRRVNIEHRIVYQVIEEEKIVKIIRMWTQYE
jgi:toxin YoeB